MNGSLCRWEGGFDVAKRGYSRAQVDERLERLDADLKMLTADRDAAMAGGGDLARQLEIARGEIADLRGQVDRLAQPPTSVEGLSERLQRMLRLAQDALCAAASPRLSWCCLAEPDGADKSQVTPLSRRACVNRI